MGGRTAPREPGWVLDSALRQTGNHKVFAEHLSQLHPHTIEQLRLGKKSDQLLEEAAGLNKQLDHYAYGAPAIRFSDDDIDQARAAGVVIEFERSAPIIVDRPLFRELAKGAIKRTVSELQQRVQTRAEEKQASRRASTATPADSLAEIHRDEQRQLCELSEQAHGVNLDVGTGLLNGLSTVDPSNMEVVIWRC